MEWTDMKRNTKGFDQQTVSKRETVIKRKGEVEQVSKEEFLCKN